MSDVENTDRPRPVHPRCSAADGPQAPDDTDRSADALDWLAKEIGNHYCYAKSNYLGVPQNPQSNEVAKAAYKAWKIAQRIVADAQKRANQN